MERPMDRSCMVITYLGSFKDFGHHWMDYHEAIDLWGGFVFCSVFFFSQRDVLEVNSIKEKGPIMEAKTSSSKLTAIVHVYVWVIRSSNGKTTYIAPFLGNTLYHYSFLIIIDSKKSTSFISQQLKWAC